MPELKRIPTPMQGTIKTSKRRYSHAATTTSSSFTSTPPRRKPLPAHRRRRQSNEIMNYIDHIIDNGVPKTPQVSGSREITKPYIRLSNTSQRTTRTAPMENSISSMETCNDEILVTPESHSVQKMVSESKEEDRRHQTALAVWGWDSGLDSEDGDVDIWDEIFFSKCRHNKSFLSVSKQLF